MRRIGSTALFLATVLCAAALPCRGADAAIDDEIARLGRELAQVRSERQNNRTQVAQDKREFADYTDRTRQRLDRLSAETDSVKRQVRALELRRDSLDAQLGAVRAGARDYSLRQEQFRRRLVDACDSLLVRARALPPLAGDAITASLSLLRSESASSAVDNVEGVNRLYQIISELRDAMGSIQTTEGPSSIAGLRGTIYRIRIGALFEAAADEKGELVAVWTGRDAQGAPTWRIAKDAATAGRVLKAVAVREGKAVPEVVDLPLDASSAQEGRAP
jgi:hypothetical protein